MIISTSRGERNRPDPAGLIRQSAPLVVTLLMIG